MPWRKIPKTWKNRCIGLRKNGVRCRRLGSPTTGLCHGCQRRVAKGGKVEKCYLPWAKVKEKRRLKALESEDGAQS